MSKSFIIKLAVIVNLVAMAFLMAFAVKDDSPTSDEPPHILSGYVALRYGHDYIDIEHPLLTKMVAATPLLFQDIKVDLEDPNYIQQREELDIGNMFDTSRDFLSYSDNNSDQILFSSRLPMIVLTALFGIVVFLLAKRLFGELAALIAVFLYSTESLILSNGSLFNTDMPITGFTLLSIYTLLLYLDKPNYKRLSIFIGSLSFVFLTKFSTIYLLPIFFLLIVYLLKGQKVDFKKHILLIVISLIFIISGFYGLVSFRDRGLEGFIPWRYLEGLGRIFYSVSVDGRFSYLLGESYVGGRWYYFPIVILTKTHVLTLLGFFTSLVLVKIRKVSISKKDLMVTLIPIGVYFSLALISKFNIGIRHVLPIYPIIIIYSAGGLVLVMRLLIERLPKVRPYLFIGVFLVAIFVARFWSLSTTYPHFLSYYNVLAGGTDNGWKISNDANYDWGQDIKRLGEYINENNIEFMAVDNFSGLYAATDLYNLPVRQFSPSEKSYKGYVALSTSVITFYEDKVENYSWIVDKREPIARAGKSIFIYKIE